jgi:DNA replication protein DnaC
MRKEIHDEEYRKYLERWNEIQWRYEHEREALLAEFTRRCPHCGRTLEPTVLERRPTSERPSPEESKPRVLEPKSGGVQIVVRERCGCSQEADAERLEEEMAASVQRAEEARRQAEALQRAGLVGKLARATLDSYVVENKRQELQKLATRQYCDALLADKLGEQPWLIFYGPYGLGKTHLAAAVLHEAMRVGWRNCYFRPWAEYLRRLMNSFERDAEERTGDIVDELARGKLVVIDDLDSKPPSKSGFAEAELFTVLNRRYNDRAPTILTFNHVPDEMVPWLGAAVVDRLIEVQFRIVQFTGESYRSELQWSLEGVA